MLGAIMTCEPRRADWPQVRAWWPGWRLVVDDGRGIAETFCRTLEAAAEVSDAPGWAVMAQDDIEPLPGLVEGFPRLLSEVPPALGMISLFSASPVADARDLRRGVRWRPVPRGGYPRTCCLAVRAGLVAEMVAGVRAEAGSRHDDERIAWWLAKRPDLRAATHLPSLVQHRGRVSVMGHAFKMFGRERVATTWPEGRTLAQVLGW